MIRKSTILSSFLVLALVTILASPVCTTESVINRAHRMLYEIKESEEVLNYCKTHSVDIEKYRLTYEERSEARDKIKDRYASIIHQYKNGVEFSLQGAKSFASSVSWRTGLTVGAVFLVLYGVTFLGFLIWSLIECKWEQCCCIRKYRDNRKYGAYEFRYLSPIILLGSLAMGLVIIILVITWAVFIGGMVKRVPHLKCAGGLLYSRMVDGYNQETYVTSFIGLSGIIEAVGNLIYTSTVMKGLRSSEGVILRKS